MTDFDVLTDIFPQGEDAFNETELSFRERICQFVETIEEGIQEKSPLCCIAFKASFLNSMADMFPPTYYTVVDPWFNRQQELNRHICFKCWFFNSIGLPSKKLNKIDRSCSQLLRSFLWLF